MVKNIKNNNKTNVKQSVNVKVNIEGHKKKSNKRVNRKRKPVGGVSSHNPYIQSYNPVFIQSGNAPHLEPPSNPLTSNPSTASVPQPVNIPKTANTFTQDNPIHISKKPVQPKPLSLLSSVRTPVREPKPPKKEPEFEDIYPGGSAIQGNTEGVLGGSSLAGGGSSSAGNSNLVTLDTPKKLGAKPRKTLNATARTAVKLARMESAKTLAEIGSAEIKKSTRGRPTNAVVAERRRKQAEDAESLISKQDTIPPVSQVIRSPIQNAATPKKGRGRPKGSKNKPKI